MKRTPSGIPSSIARQRGVTALFVTLIVLLVMMVLGISAALLSGTQFKLAGNLQHENAAFNLAEGSTAAAQNWLTSGANFKDSGFSSSGTAAHLYCIPGSAGCTRSPGDPLTMTWNDTNSLAVSGDDTQRYQIQKVASCQVALGSESSVGGRIKAPVERADLFRVTARGTSVKGTNRVLQTTYTVPIDADDIRDGYCGPLP